MNIPVDISLSLRGINFERLGVYNAECHRGILHHESYEIEMAKIQVEFDEHVIRQAAELGATFL